LVGERIETSMAEAELADAGFQYRHVA
jgi:hypothetical protein